ncbi:hypothetical protein FS842_004437 [Serendipita sp. 407]|nr:hypothetical protein FS842_004437 [Serendipita sp. 407]
MNYSQSQVFWALHLSFSREFSVGVQFLQFDNVVSDLNAINYALDPKDKGENLQGSGVDESIHMDGQHGKHTSQYFPVCSPRCDKRRCNPSNSLRDIYTSNSLLS